MAKAKNAPVTLKFNYSVSIKAVDVEYVIRHLFDDAEYLLPKSDFFKFDVLCEKMKGEQLREMIPYKEQAALIQEVFASATGLLDAVGFLEITESGEFPEDAYSTGKKYLRAWYAKYFKKLAEAASKEYAEQEILEEAKYAEAAKKNHEKKRIQLIAELRKAGYTITAPKKK